MDNEAKEKYAAVAKAVDGVIEALKAVEEESALLRARALTLYGLMIWAQDTWRMTTDGDLFQLV